MTVSCRFSDAEKRVIEHWAGVLGVSVREFLRIVDQWHQARKNRAT